MKSRILLVAGLLFLYFLNSCGMRECTCEYNDGTSDSSLMSKDDCDKFDRTARSLGTGYCYYE